MSETGPARCWKDKGVLEKIGARWIDSDFPELKHTRILYTWRTPARDGDDGMKALASAKGLPNNLRDVFGYDFQIEVAAEFWKQMNKEARRRLIWHELRHCRVLMDEEQNEPERDKAGRAKIFVEPHDLVIRTFKDEIKKFGMSPADVKVAKFLIKQIKKGKVSDIELPDDTEIG